MDTSEQLRNVSKMKLYKYRYSREYMEHAGLDTSDCEGEDTGVLAQEVKEVLPEAVKESVSKFWLLAQEMIRTIVNCVLALL